MTDSYEEGKTVYGIFCAQQGQVPGKTVPAWEDLSSAHQEKLAKLLDRLIGAEAKRSVKKSGNDILRWN